MASARRASCSTPFSLREMLFWAVVSDSTEEAVEPSRTLREEAEAIIQAWYRDEPDDTGGAAGREGRVSGGAGETSPPPCSTSRYRGRLTST
jgi:hypothetical protein